MPLKYVQTGPEHVLQVLREVERAGERAKVSEGRGADLEYLKNILLKMYETGKSRQSSGLLLGGGEIH